VDSRRRILAALSGDELDRVPLTEIGIWPETLLRWRQEGLPAGMTPHEYFDLDPIEFFSFDGSLGLAETVLREGEGFRVYTDADGCTYKMLVDRPGAPQLLGSRVAGLEDWQALRGNLRPELERFEEFRKEIVFGQTLAECQPDRYRRCRREKVFSALVPLEPCWYYLRLLGEEEALATIALDPEFAGTVIREYNEFTLGMVKRILSAGYRFDALWVFSDLCFKNGMLFSPDFFVEEVLPHQRRLFDLARENKMKVIFHCDGYVGQLLPLLKRAGIDCIQPLEVRAGNDVGRYIQEHSDTLSYMGNINMDLLTTTKEAIEREVRSKILEAKGTHRYLFHSDHSVPDTVSLERYAFAVQVAREAAWYDRGTGPRT
jgi:uroporphyrinogen decarboxylase